jgi:hypothetical protein
MTYTYGFNADDNDIKYYKGQIIAHEEAHRIATELGEDVTYLETKLTELKAAYEALGGTYE